MTPRICIIDTFRDHESESGGHAIRVSNIASYLVKHGNSVLLIRPGEAKSISGEYAPQIVSMGSSRLFAPILHFVQARLFPGMRHAQDVLIMNGPSTLMKIRTLLKSADLVQLEDPTLVTPLLLAKVYRRRIVVDSDGVSSQVYRESIAMKGFAIQSLLAYAIVLLCERIWFRLSSIIATSSPDDRELVSKIHDIDPRKIVTVPNPLDTSFEGGPFMSRENVRASLGISAQKPIALFVGDLRTPHNFEAVDFICKMFQSPSRLSNSGAHALIVGRYDEVPVRWKIPNLTLTGPVKDLASIISAVDVCMAPLLSQQTGVKTKVLTYLAFGKTTVATSTGTKGLDRNLRKHVIECTPAEFPQVLAETIASSSNAPPNREALIMVKSLYGAGPVGQIYQREVLESFAVH